MEDFPIHIKNGEPLDLPNEGLDVKEFWTARKDAVLKDRKPRGKLERFLEVELFALPPGGSYQMSFAEWLRVSGGIKNPYKYMKDKYGSAIVCTRKDKRTVVFSKIEDEDIFHDYKEDILEDAFKERYKGAPVEVELGDYWYVFSDVKIKKLKIISFDKETMRYDMEDQGINKRHLTSKVVHEEGFFEYGEPLTSRGSAGFPYSSYYDRLWFAQEYRNCMDWRSNSIYRILRTVENVSNPQALHDILALTDEWIAGVRKIKRELKAQMMEHHRRKMELKRKKDEQKNWLN